MYKHFSVIHKYSFKKVYVNNETNQKVVCHTNQIEGAWKHAKDYFKRMSGSELSQFEGHLAEVMWRADVKGELYKKFFELLSSIYKLYAPVEFTYPTPLFDSWTMEPSDTPIDKWQIVHAETDAESESSAQSQSETENEGQNEVVEISSGSDIPPNRPVAQSSSMRMCDAMTEKMISSLFSSGSMSEDETEKTLIEESSGANAFPLATTSSEQPTLTFSKRTEVRKDKSKVPEQEEPSTSVGSETSHTAQSTSSRQHTRTRKPTGQKSTESEGASVRPQRMRLDKICHLRGYRQANEEKKNSKKTSPV